MASESRRAVEGLHALFAGHLFQIQPRGQPGLQEEILQLLARSGSQSFVVIIGRIRAAETRGTMPPKEPSALLSKSAQSWWLELSRELDTKQEKSLRESHSVA